MTKKRMFAVLLAMIGCLCIAAVWQPDTASAAKKKYTIGPKSKPCDKDMLGFHQYNSKTRQYYTVRSYLEKMEKKGGGTLVFKKGTYTITNTLYVPSNVTLLFKDGVVLKKGSKTGVSDMPASSAIFQLIRPSRSKKKGVYGKYKGEKNISFIGEGTVKIDLKKRKKNFAIIMGHNKNVKVDNIIFQNVYGGHFIEMDASKKVQVTNCTFKDAKVTSSVKAKEAINLDTPDKVTNGWSQDWSKYDKTPNMNVTISNCTFKNLGRAIGTHMYSQGKYHTNIKILNCTIQDTESYAIRVLNWKDCVITGNTMIDCREKGASGRIMMCSGAINPTITGNVFQNAPRAIGFMPYKNTPPGNKYAITYNKLSQANKDALVKNTFINIEEGFIRINHKYKEFVKDTEKLYFREPEEKEKKNKK